MTKQILIAEKLRIAAILNNERVDQLIVAQGQHQIGDIYLGMVENVHPGIDAAFVKIGESERNGFIHVTDLGPLRLRQTAGSITELLEPRQKALVQVIKEPTGNKGPRLTGNITLPGRFLVLQPNGRGVNISRRIHEEEERDRLRALAVLIKPAGTGLLVRTKAEGIGEDQIIDDLEALCRQWETIQATAETSQPPALLNRDDDFVHRTLRDHCGPDPDKIVVDGPQVAERVKAFLGVEKNTTVVDSFASAEELMEAFRINGAIRQALLPRVDLPSGGYVVIEPTEALTVIDVNSGSFTRSATSRETVLWTNCEAATEIARQLQLRNIGGMIIVDFIDMESRRDQLLLLEHFMKAMAPDKARPQIAQLTELGLVELTRKRQGQNIYELFGRQQPDYAGQGHGAVAPGKAPMQPLATESGHPPMTPAASGEVGSDGGRAAGGGKRRRRGGGRNGPQAATETPAVPNAVTDEPGIVPSPEAESATPAGEPEPVTVPMSRDQETVFSWCGFNPALMASTPPKDLNNVAVRVVGSGEDTPTPSAEETTVQATGNGSLNRRRRQSDSIETDKPSVAPAVATNRQPGEQQSRPQMQEESSVPVRQRRSHTRSRQQNPLPVAADQDSSPTPSPETVAPGQVETPMANREKPGPVASGQTTDTLATDGTDVLSAAGANSQEEQDDGRRRRRRRRPLT